MLRLLSESQPRSPVVQAESIQTNKITESSEDSIKSDHGTSSSIVSRYDTASKDQEYRQTGLRLASEMKREKALEQEVSDFSVIYQLYPSTQSAFRHIGGHCNRSMRIEKQ
jgi:hypothetical protein